MNGRELAIVALAGAVGAAATLALGAGTGMGGADLRHLAILLGVAIPASVGVTWLAGRLLAGASFRSRLVAGTAAGVAVALVNLAAVALLMFVSSHDAVLMAILLGYAAAVGSASAFALSRGPARGVARLRETTRRLAAGDLSARAGDVGGGPELQGLAAALDDMGARLEVSLARERATEARRRDLISAVSHDLRTPLAGIRAIVEAVEDGMVDDAATLRRYAAEMGQQVGNLAVLVDDLFELSQLDAGAIQAETERARLSEILGSVMSAVGTQARQKGISFETRLDGTEEALCSPRLVRVLQNLVQNAIRHTPADGSIVVEARHERDGLAIAVADTGDGIPPEALERVFDPFWRGDTARSSQGSGLGLTLAKRIVEAMGGDISVESEPRRGARFRLLLPT